MFTSLFRTMFVCVLLALHTAEAESANKHADLSKPSAKQRNNKNRNYAAKERELPFSDNEVLERYAFFDLMSESPHYASGLLSDAPNERSNERMTAHPDKGGDGYRAPDAHTQVSQPSPIEIERKPFFSNTVVGGSPSLNSYAKCPATNADNGTPTPAPGSQHPATCPSFEGPTADSNERTWRQTDQGGNRFRAFSSEPPVPPHSEKRDPHAIPRKEQQKKNQLPPATEAQCRQHGGHPAPYYAKRNDYSGCITTHQFTPSATSKVDWESLGARRIDFDMELGVTLRILAPVITDLVSTAAYVQGTLGTSYVTLALSIVVNIAMSFMAVYQLMQLGRVSSDLSSPNDVAEIISLLVDIFMSCALSFTLFYSARTVKKDDASLPLLWGAVSFVFLYAAVGRLTSALPVILTAYLIVLVAFAISAMRTGRNATQEAFFVVVVVIFIRVMEFMQQTTPGMLLSYLDDPNRRNSMSGFYTVLTALLCGGATSDFAYSYSYETDLLDVASPNIVRSLAYLVGGGTQYFLFIAVFVTRFAGFALFKFATAARTYNIKYALGAGSDRRDTLFACYVSQVLVPHMSFSDRGLMGSFVSIMLILVQMKQNVVFFFFSFAVYYAFLVCYPTEMTTCMKSRPSGSKNQTTSTQNSTQPQTNPIQPTPSLQQPSVVPAPALLQQHGAVPIATHEEVVRLLPHASFSKQDLALVNSLAVPIGTLLSTGYCANLNQHSLLTCGHLFVKNPKVPAADYKLPVTLQEYTVSIRGMKHVPASVRVTPVFTSGEFSDCLVTLTFDEVIADVHEDPILGARSSDVVTTLARFQQNLTMGAAEFMGKFVYTSHPSAATSSGNSLTAVTPNGVAIAAIHIGLAEDGRSIARVYDPSEFTSDPCVPPLAAAHGGRSGRESRASSPAREAAPQSSFVPNPLLAPTYVINEAVTDSWGVTTEKKKANIINNLPLEFRSSTEHLFSRYEKYIKGKNQETDSLRRRLDAAKRALSSQAGSQKPRRAPRDGATRSPSPPPAGPQRQRHARRDEAPRSPSPVQSRQARLCNCRDPTRHAFCPYCDECRKFHATNVSCADHAVQLRERIRLERELHLPPPTINAQQTVEAAPLGEDALETPPAQRGQSRRSRGKGRNSSRPKPKVHEPAETDSPNAVSSAMEAPAVPVETDTSVQHASPVEVASATQPSTPATTATTTVSSSTADAASTSSTNASATAAVPPASVVVVVPSPEDKP